MKAKGRRTKVVEPHSLLFLFYASRVWRNGLAAGHPVLGRGLYWTEAKHTDKIRLQSPALSKLYDIYAPT